MARAGADNVFAVGPQEDVLPAALRFVTEIYEGCNLQLEWSKTVLYCREGVMPFLAPPGMKVAGERVGDNFHQGLMVYGVPVGSAEDVTYKLKEKAAEMLSNAEKT